MSLPEAVNQNLLTASLCQNGKKTSGKENLSVALRQNETKPNGRKDTNTPN